MASTSVDAYQRCFLRAINSSYNKKGGPFYGNRLAFLFALLSL